MKNLLLTTSILLIALSLKAQKKEQPLSPTQVKTENKATAVEEIKVASETSDLEQALRDGKDLTIKPAPGKTKISSVSENSKFGKNIVFDGTWTLEVNAESNELILTGGTLANKKQQKSDKIRMMVYVADKPFDMNNPEMIGTAVSTTDLEPIEASANKIDQSYIMPLVIDEKVETGSLFPYIVVGEFNPTINNYEITDVKPFGDRIQL